MSNITYASARVNVRNLNVEVFERALQMLAQKHKLTLRRVGEKRWELVDVFGRDVAVILHKDYVDVKGYYEYVDVVREELERYYTAAAFEHVLQTLGFSVEVNPVGSAIEVVAVKV